MENLFLSIIISVYNSENFLNECLDSIFTQDVKHSCYEVICVDDGSLDNSLAILNNYKQKYNNIKVFSKQNGGASSARNLGLKYATGKYLWFIDSDDYIYNYSLIKLFDLLKKETPDIVCFLPESKPIIKEKPLKYRIDCYLLTPVAHENVVRLDIIKDNNVSFKEDLVFGEDSLFWFTAINYCKKIIHLEMALYFYRNNSKSITNSINSKPTYDKRISDFLKIHTTLKDYLKQGIVPKGNIIPLCNFMRFIALDILFGSMPQSSLSCKECLNVAKKYKLFLTFNEKLKYIFNKKFFKNKSKLKTLYATIFQKNYFIRNYKKQRNSNE